MNLPIGAAALTFGLLYLADQESDAPGRFDLTGFVLSGVGFAALMYGVSEGAERGWETPAIVTSLTVGAILLSALLWQQLRVKQPLLNLRLFTNRLFRSATAVTFVLTAAFLGVLYVVALFFQDGLGMSALESGLSTFPEAFGVMLGAQVVSRYLYPWLGPRRIMVGGLVALGTTMLALTTISSRDQLWEMRVLMFVMGYCVAHVMVPSQAASMAQIDRASTGSASTLYNAIRQLGSAVGIALLSTVISTVGVSSGRRGHADLTGYHAAFGVAAGLAFAGSLLALTIHDADAESTRTARRSRVRRAPVERLHSPA